MFTDGFYTIQMTHGAMGLKTEVTDAWLEKNQIVKIWSTLGSDQPANFAPVVADTAQTLPVLLPASSGTFAFLPGTAQAISIFDAGSAADVTAVNQQAGVPAADVVEAIDLRSAAGR